MRRVTGIGISHSKKPFIITRINFLARTRCRDNLTQEQGSTTFKHAEDIPVGKDNSLPGIKNMNFFSEVKGGVGVTVSTPSPAPTK